MNEHERLSKRLKHSSSNKIVLGYYEARRLLEEYESMIHQINDLDNTTEETTTNSNLSQLDYINGGDFGED